MLSCPYRLTPLALTLLGGTLQAASVEVIDPLLDPAATFLAYTEFELSGEPLAEALGLDLDSLDPDALDQPTRFDYIAGIESYEYSEEGMYALNYQSGAGPHLTFGLRNQARGGQLSHLGQRFSELAQSVGYPLAEIPLNLYPLAWPYRLLNPQLATPADLTEVNRDGSKIIPAFYRDYASLRWQRQGVEAETSPAALAGILLKEVMWSQDFLGGMHTTAGDEEVVAERADQDQDPAFALGVSAVDGLNGMILTELSLEKMQVLLEQMSYNGQQLGVAVNPQYDASQPIWFPHLLGVQESHEGELLQAQALQVLDARSQLRDTWMLLWPAAELLAMSDQRQANSQHNPAFRAVFDGAPFAATAAANQDVESDNDVYGEDAFALANTLARLSFRNLQKLHFNPQLGTLADSWNGQTGNSINSYDAAYALVALSVFQKAQDALPVGYAAGEAGKGGLNTPLGQEALQLLKQQADFILTQLRDGRGLIVDGAHLTDNAVHPLTAASLDTQFAVLRGLGAAFAATGDQGYRQAGRELYLAIEQHLFDPALGSWASIPGQPTVHSPYSAAAISAGMRTALLQLRNEGSEQEPALEVAQLVQRYSDWFRLIINGPSPSQGMQLAEWLGDSGENLLSQDSGDNDGDQVAHLAKAGRAMVLARQVRVSAD